MRNCLTINVVLALYHSASLEDQAPDGSKLAGGLAADSPAVIKRRLKKSVSTEEEKEEEKKLEGKRRASELMTEETVKTGTVRIHVLFYIDSSNNNVLHVP